MRFLTFAAFIIIGANLSYAQKVLYGMVLDATTNLPIKDVSIRVDNMKRMAVTDDDGLYRLELPKHVSGVTVKCMGYENFSIPKKVLERKDNKIKYNIRLFPSNIEIPEVVVIARDEARKLRESAMPISVISAKDLQGTCSSINEVIARTAGITIRNTGGVGSASRISVRGLEGKRMGLFIEDWPCGETNDYLTLNDIPTDLIERVEVYKGIVPYKFGGNAMGGAVNVVMKEYPPLYTDVGYEISSFNTHRFNTVFKRKNKKLGLEFGFGGFYTHSDNNYKMRLKNIDDRIVRRDHDKFDKYTIAGSVKATKWWFDEVKVELSYIHNKQEIQGIDYDIREAYNKSGMFASACVLKKENFLLPGLDFDYNFIFNVVNSGEKDMAEYKYDWDGNKYAPVSAFGGETGTFPTDGDNHSQYYYSKLNLNYILNKTHSFNLNLYGNYIYQNPKDELMDKALGFKANFPNRMGSVTTGLSYDLHLFDGRLQSATTIKNYHYRTKTKMSDLLYFNEPKETRINRTYWGWSEALRYKFTKEFLVKASFSNEFRIPTNEELIGNGYSILPSPLLIPEKNKAVN